MSRKNTRQISHKKLIQKSKYCKTKKLKISRSVEYEIFENELPKSLNNDFYTRNDIVVLCLAFNGVTQPIIWRYWWDLCKNKKNLKFIVHSPSPYGEEEIYNPEFCYYNRLNLPFREFAYIDALRYIIEVLYQNRPPKMIYLVSGSHIPITPAEEIIKKSVKDYICSDYQQWIGLTGQTALRLCIHMDDNWFKQKTINCSDKTYILQALYELGIDAGAHNQIIFF